MRAQRKAEEDALVDLNRDTEIDEFAEDWNVANKATTDAPEATAPVAWRGEPGQAIPKVTKEAVDAIIDAPENWVIKNLALFVKRHLKEGDNTPINFVDSIDRAATDFEGKPILGYIMGSYNFNVGVTVSRRTPASSRQAVILHEAMHGVTKRKLQEAAVLPQDHPMRIAYDKLDRITKDIQKQLLAANKQIVTYTEKDGSKRLLNVHRARNIDEVISGVFDDKYFRHWLKGQPSKGYTNLLREVIALLGHIMGMKSVKDANLLTDIISLTDEISRGSTKSIKTDTSIII
jgi:hypothetical protein